MVDKVNKLQPRHHHATEAARKAREERALAEQGGNQPEVIETPQVAVQPQPVAPVVAAPVVPPVQAVAPVVSAQNNIMFSDPAAAPQKSQREIELEQQLEAARQREDQLTTQLTTTQQTVSEAQKAADEELAALRKFRSDIELNNLVDLGGTEFETLDPAMAQELSQKVFKPLVGRLQQDYNDRLNVTQAELRAEQQKRIEAESKMSDDQLAKQCRAINDTIFKAHPDFEQVRNSQEFATFAAQPSRPGAALSLGAMMANEYYGGNADFVIQAVNEFKQGRPSLESIAGAPTTVTATVPAGESNEPQYTEDDVADWNRQRATGKLSREEYGKLRQAYNAQRTAAQAAS
jgi:hypothetical protein